MRRALAFEHCEPRLTLSGTAPATLSLVLLSAPNGSEGGFVEYELTIRSDVFASDVVAAAGLGDQNVYLSTNDGTIVPISIRPADRTTVASDLVFNQNGQRWNAYIDDVDGDVAIVVGGIWVRPAKIPTPVPQPPDDGGSVTFANWPESGIGPIAPASVQPQMANTPEQPQLPVVRPTSITPAEVTHVDGLRGRAMVFDVAASAPRLGQRSPLEASLATGPAWAAVSPTAMDPLATRLSRHVAAVDAAHEASPVAPQVRHAVSTSADDALIRTVAVQNEESIAEAVAPAIASRPSLEARDQALADDSTTPSRVDAAAIFDPTRNRPILGVAGVSLLLAVWSLYGPRPSGDQAPVEQHPPRRTWDRR